MPNWVSNRIYIKNNCPEFEEIKSLLTNATTKNDSLFQSIKPMPEELLKSAEFLDRIFLKGLSSEEVFGSKKISETESLFLKEKYSQYKFSEEELKEHTKNFEQFGVKDWYEWRVHHWGCKWEASEVELSISDANEITISFETPWNWPSAVYETLSDKYPNTLILIYAYSWESSFVKYGRYAPGLGWHLQRIELPQPGSNEMTSVEMDKEIAELASQFKYPPQTEFGWVRAAEDDPINDLSPEDLEILFGSKSAVEAGEQS